jgi:hypothetical protein
LVTYVLDGIESAMAQARAAAGDRHVLVHGAYTAQRALEAGVLDELQISQVPVLFGGGRRLFDVLPSRIEVEIVKDPGSSADDEVSSSRKRLCGLSFGRGGLSFGRAQALTGSPRNSMAWCLGLRPVGAAPQRGGAEA